MAKVKIVRPDGSPSPYLWDDKEKSDDSLRTAYKKTKSGIKRLKGVQYDIVENTFRKD
jgi:hypothetical protein